MARRISQARLKYRIKLAHKGSFGKVNPNTGRPGEGYVDFATVWAGEWHKTISQSIETNGPVIKREQNVLIRHNPKLNLTDDGSVYVQFKGTWYTLSELVEGLDYQDPDFDFLTIGEVDVKHG